MKEEIIDFLKLDNPELWDFTNDCENQKYIEMEDTIEKYLNYKSLRIHPNNKTEYKEGKKLVEKNKELYKGVNDPDTKSPTLQEIYKILWKDITNKDFMRYGEIIAADTMTSVSNTLNQYIRKNIETNEERKNIRKGYVSTLYITELYARNPKEFVSRLKKNKNLERFISLYHTIGNFTVTPCLFNSARSGSYARHDYWDLTLMQIKRWYMAKNNTEKNQILTALLHIRINQENKETKMNSCRKWLEYYGNGIEGWKNFITKNYFDDFIDKNNEYEPILFCNHSWKKSNIPEEEFDKFFITVSDLIQKRGERLIKELKKKIK